ncbi:MAG TPA: coenzyme F420-0:L-glutamate ligase [Patescibacteria group bacterium]|nr:coenzyme F420-0:L-glutamate ligase [Patescibacteria group bacterium]
MIVKAYKTHKVKVGDDLLEVLDKYLPRLKERDVVVVTSKIVSICQGRVIKNDGKVSKLDLVKKDAQYYLPEKYLRFGVNLTVTNNVFIASAGIDESNGYGNFILWPKDPMKEAERIWKHLRKKHKVKNLGVVITDSHLTPLRRGVTGFGIAWCGFAPLKSYIGKPDIFGRNLRLEMTNLVDSVAASAVFETGEGGEQTPIVVINDPPHLKFKERPPTKAEIKEMTIPLDEDIYSGLLTSVKWKRGRA